MRVECHPATFTCCATLGRFLWWSCWATVRCPLERESNLPCHVGGFVQRSWASSVLGGRAALDRLFCVPWALWQQFSTSHGKRACEKEGWRAIIIRAKVATERCSARCYGCLPHYFCPAAGIVLHILGKRDGVRLLRFHCSFTLLKWTEGGEKISVGLLIYLKMSSSCSSCKTRIPWCEMSSMLLLTFVPVVVLFTYWNWIPFWSYMDGLSEENSLKCIWAASQIYHSYQSTLKQKLSRCEATTCRPYNQLFLLFWIILYLSCYFLGFSSVFFVCLFCFYFPSLSFSLLYISPVWLWHSWIWCGSYQRRKQWAVVCSRLCLPRAVHPKRRQVVQV